jgi:hypothetical protein
VTNAILYINQKHLHIQNHEKEIIIEEAYESAKNKCKTLLDPLWIELAEIVARCYHKKSKTSTTQKLRRIDVDEMIEAVGSQSLRLVWREKQAQYQQQSASSKMHPLKNYIKVVPPKQRVMFQKYRNYLLTYRDIGATMSYKPKLSCYLKELGYLVAKCRLIHHAETKTNGHMLKNLTEMIQDEGSSKLQTFWNEKMSTQTIQKYGLCHAIPPNLRDLFREYYTEVMQRIQMQSGMQSESHKNLTKNGNDSDFNSISEGYDNSSKKKSSEDYKKSRNQDDKVVLIPQEIPSCPLNQSIFMPIEKCWYCQVKQQGHNGTLVTDTPYANPDTANLISSQLELPPPINQFPLPPDLIVLAKLLLRCHVTTHTFQICHHCLSYHISSCDCQVLKDRWRGMVTLPRFQRDGYKTIIPISQREAFQLYVNYLLSLQINCPLLDSLMTCVLDPERMSALL